MRKVLVGALAACLVAASLSAAGAARKPVRLGTDPSGDSAPAIDITYLDVGVHGLLTDDGPVQGLQIRIGVDGMLPDFGSYPEVPAFEWIFTIGKRTFIAEAVAGRTPRFFLFELKGDAHEQLESPFGQFNVDGGYILIGVPFDAIGAKKGAVVSGVKTPLEVLGNNGNDVDVHFHVGAITEYIDEMKTTKSFVIP